MAISDFGTYLYIEGTTSGKYKKLVDIKSAPATGSAPKNLDTTTLSDSQTTAIPDRPETPAMEFDYNFNKTDFAAVVAAVSLTTDKKFMIVYQDKSGFQFSARGATFVKDVSIGEVVDATISLTATTVPTFVADCSTYFETTP